MSLTRRNVLAGFAAGAGTLAAARLAGAADDGDKLRIACIAPLSGAGQIYGDYIRQGVEIAVDRINTTGGVKGKAIELVLRDDGGDPNNTVAVFKELSGQGIRLFAEGPFTSSILASMPLLRDADATMVIIGTTGLALTHEDFNSHAFRMGYTAPMAYGGQAYLFAKKLPSITKWAVIATDTGALHDIVSEFTAGLKKEYPKLAHKQVTIVDPIYTKFGADDFKNQISQLVSSDADGLYTAMQGNDAFTLFQQARGFGLDQKFKAIGDSGIELALAKAMGKNTPKNMWSFTGWYVGANPDNPLSQNLYREYVARTKDDYPNWFVGVAHDSITALASAAAVAPSTEAKDMIPALEIQKPLGAIGKIDFRKEDHQLLAPLVYLNFGGDASQPKGWKLYETVTLPSAEFVEPPTPGKKFPG